MDIAHKYNAQQSTEKNKYVFVPRLVFIYTFAGEITW